MIVVFWTCVRVGQETRFISARTSCKYWTKRGGPDCDPLWPRSRRATLPSAPSPKRAVRGGTNGASGLSVSAIKRSINQMAGVPGFEHGLSVLETDVLTVDTIPLRH